MKRKNKRTIQEENDKKELLARMEFLERENALLNELVRMQRQVILSIKQKQKI